MANLSTAESRRALSTALRRTRSVSVEFVNDDAFVVTPGGRTPIRLVWAGEGFPYDLRRVGVEPGRELPNRSVVVMRRASDGARTLLEEMGANWADAEGNAHLEMGDLVIMTGSWMRSGWRNAASLDFTKGTWAVAETVLDAHHRGHGKAQRSELASVSRLAEASGTSAANVSRALQTFDNAGFTRKMGSERGSTAARVLDDPSGLLSAWAAWYKTRRIVSRAFSSVTVGPVEFIERVQAFSESPVVVTGWRALEQYAPFATASPGTAVYVAPYDLPRVLVSAGDGPELRPVASGGRFTILQADPQTIPLAVTSAIGTSLLASPIRVYGDLLRSSVRGDDAAENLREVVLGF